MLLSILNHQRPFWGFLDTEYCYLECDFHVHSTSYISIRSLIFTVYRTQSVTLPKHIEWQSQPKISVREANGKDMKPTISNRKSTLERLLHGFGESEHLHGDFDTSSSWDLEGLPISLCVLFFMTQLMPGIQPSSTKIILCLLNLSAAVLMKITSQI